MRVKNFEEVYPHLIDEAVNSGYPIIYVGVSGSLSIAGEMLLRIAKEFPLTTIVDGDDVCTFSCPYVFHLYLVDCAKASELKHLDNAYIYGCQNLSQIKVPLSKSFAPHKRALAFLNVRKTTEELIQEYSEESRLIFIQKQELKVIPSRAIIIVSKIFDNELLTLLFFSEKKGKEAQAYLEKLHTEKPRSSFAYAFVPKKEPFIIELPVSNSLLFIERLKVC